MNRKFNYAYELEEVNNVYRKNRIGEGRVRAR